MGFFAENGHFTQSIRLKIGHLLSLVSEFGPLITPSYSPCRFKSVKNIA